MKVFRTIGICGGGKMGTSFFKTISHSGFDIVFYLRNKEKLTKLEKSYLRTSKGRQKNSVRFTDDIRELGCSDIVFEFISEDISAKRAVIEELLSLGQNTDQVIATCSSSFTPERINVDYGKNNIIGVHFIYPVQFMKSVEILYGDKTEGKIVSKVQGFLKGIDKRPVLVEQRAGIFSVKLLSCIQNEAFRVFKEYNISPGTIDNIIRDLGFAMPPFDMIDSVGFRIISNCTKEFYEGTDEYMYYQGLKEFLDQETEKGISGKKSGKGFYDYTGLKRDYRRSMDWEIEKDVKDVVIDRLKMIYINNALRYVDTCQLSCEDIDSFMSEVNQSEKGPIQLALDHGVENVYEALVELKGKYGLPFKPPRIIQYMAQNKLGSDEIDRQIRMFKMGGERPGWYHKDMEKTC